MNCLCSPKSCLFLLWIASSAVQALPKDYTSEALYPSYFIGVDLDYHTLDSGSGLGHQSHKHYSYGVHNGIRLSDSLDWTLGFQNLGKLVSSTNDDLVKLNSIESSLSYRWYKFEDVSLYTSLGLSRWNLKQHGYSDHGYSPMGEFGLSYEHDDNVRFSIGYKYLNDVAQYESHAVGLNVAYQFNRYKTVPVESSDTQLTRTAQEEAIEKASSESITISPSDSRDIKVVPASPEEIVEKDKAEKVFVFSEYAFGDQYLFNFDSTYIGMRFRQHIHQVALEIKAYPQVRVKIVGHTDSTGPATYNQFLSERRALTVAYALRDAGINSSQLVVVGVGEDAPVATNATREGRRKNRRVEVVVLPFEYVVHD